MAAECVSQLTVSLIAWTGCSEHRGSVGVYTVRRGALDWGWWRVTPVLCQNRARRTDDITGRDKETEEDVDRGSYEEERGE